MMEPLAERLGALLAEGHRGTPSLIDDTPFAPPERRAAAVLVAVTARERPGVILTHRPSNMRAHPGQVAFPGGKLDPGEDAVMAAVREAYEELAIPGEVVRVVGTSDIYVTGSGYDITPVVAVIPPDLDFVPNPAEVADWFEAPLDFVLDAGNHVQRTGTLRGQERKFLEIMWQDNRIWGVTAGIIANLSRRIGWVAP